MPAQELFLEIGTEEVPSRFLRPALEDLRRLAEKSLQEARIAHGAIRTLGTPRRLVLAVEDVAEAQRPLEQGGRAPPRRVAYDESGRPTKAAQGFARSQGVSVESLEVVETGKGEYVAALKKEEGRRTERILPELLPALIERLSFPKSMRWGDGDLRFVRPIHWIAALFGGRAVSFEAAGVASGKTSRGHRFMAPGEFEVEGLARYVQEARDRFVIVDPDERAARIREAARAAAAEAGGEILRDDELLEEVAGLVEYPFPILGRIETESLGLPREVLITAMKHHQRYFSVVDGRGGLLPYFVAISNTRGQDPGVIRLGYERVLRARLSDAGYFYREDVKRPLESYLDSLKSVIFQKDLGTSFEKVERIVILAKWLAERLALEAAGATERAARLCKADLATRMVYEFPELQGIMGREYARLSGEEEAVYRAIDEHYKPRGGEDGFPSKGPAAFVGIADKLDTIVGYVALGKIPSGSEDPFGLRRAARGVLGTILAHGYRVNLSQLIDRSVELLAEKLPRIDKVDLVLNVLSFLESRLENIFFSQGFRLDLIRATLHAWERPDVRIHMRDAVDVAERLKALTVISESPDFEALTTTFKRVMNIMPGGNEFLDVLAHALDKNPKFVAYYDASKIGAERELFSAYMSAEAKINDLLARASEQSYLRTLQETATLRPLVDRFFDDVLVMEKDTTVRWNRLALLAAVGWLFAQVADFRKIVGP